MTVVSSPKRRAATPARPLGGRPSLRLERELLRQGHPVVAGVDEVGRGALAGPVTVGVVIVDAHTRTGPAGLKDSKLLTPSARDALVPKVRRWALGWAVGHASAEEIDRYGIIAALRLAGTRALADLGVTPSVVILDGNHDWLTPPAPALLELEDVGGRPTPQLPTLAAQPPVRTLIKADMRCSAVAAASVLAKTTRDTLMVDLATRHPEYGWADNKGYSARDHFEALTRHGASPLHRRSWRLPGMIEVCSAADPNGKQDD